MASAIELIPPDVGRLVAHMCQPDETGNLYDPFSRDTVVSASLTSKTMRGFFLEKLTKTAYIEDPKARKLGGPAAFKSYVQTSKIRRIIFSGMALDAEWLKVLGEILLLQELYLIEAQLLEIPPHLSFSNLRVLAIIPRAWDLSLNPLSLVGHAPQLEIVFWSMDGSTSANIDPWHFDLYTEPPRNHDAFKKDGIPQMAASQGLSLTVSVSESRGEVVGEILAIVSTRINILQPLTTFRVLYQLAPSYDLVILKSPFATEYGWASSNLVANVTRLQMAILDQPVGIDLSGLRQVQALTLQMRPESMPDLVIALASLPSSAELTELELLLFMSGTEEYAPMEQDQVKAWIALDEFCSVRPSLRSMGIVWHDIPLEDAFSYKADIGSLSLTRHLTGSLGIKWRLSSVAGVMTLA
ncbi:hypothetical protein C8J56DRAFT_885426 [Mycena floridula]|nr:hypothetical protein C8J56DRAFT_885426 [Mycena floridula]